MAVFNPAVPQDKVNDPNFFKFSDSISQPKADTSGAILGATAATAVEGTAGLADTIVKDVIKDDVYERVDQERQQFAQALTNTKDYGTPLGPQGNNAPVTGPGAPIDLLQAPDQQNVPTAIKQGIAKAGTAQAALNGNKISETTYYQRLNDIAKSMRSTYPGYREYIDQEISKITGVNPANAYISSIIQDINRQSTGADSEAKFWRNKIVDSGYPGSAEMLQYYQKTGDSNKVMQWLSYENGTRSALQLKKAVTESQNQDKETQLTSARDYAASLANKAATSLFYTTQKYANGDMSPADIADKLADLSLNPGKANDVAYQGLSERYAALHTQAYNQTMKQLYTKPKLDNGTLGKSVADILGPTEAKKIVDSTVGALFDKTREFVSDKQFGPAYTVQNQAAATVNNQVMKVLQDPTVGGTVATIATFNKLAPNFAPIMTGKFLGKGLDKDLSDFITQQGAQAIAQTGGKYQGMDGKVYSFSQAMEEIEQAGNVSGKAIPGQAVQNLLEVRRAITDPSSTPEALNNAVKFFYDPKVNKGSLDKLMDDYYDPTKRGMVRGRSSAFADLTSPEITSKIKASGAENWNKYSTWAKQEFATQLGDKAKELNAIQAEGMFHIGWDGDKKELTIVNKNGTPLAGLQASNLNLSYRVVNNINMGLRNVANLAKEEGTNVDAYMWKTLFDNGFRPTRELDGVPAQIMKALIISNGGKVNNISPPVSK